MCKLLKGRQEESLTKAVCIRDQYVRELVWAKKRVTDYNVIKSGVSISSKILEL